MSDRERESHEAANAGMGPDVTAVCVCVCVCSSPWLWLQFACLALFVLEVAFKVAVLGRKFFRNVYNWIDVVVLFITIVPW